MSRRPHFLEPLILKGTGAASHALINARTGLTLATDIELAGDSRTRTRGLLGREGLPAGSVLILAPCNGIHTFFMRFALDVVFVDRQGRVLKVCRDLRPWRVGIGLGAFAALEFATMASAPRDVARGDQLKIVS